jgi:hypothetical protein
MAREGGHWYSADGKPVYEVEGSKGKLVKPTLVHARKLGLVPGITTILRVAAKPQLTNWLRKQSILAALTLPRGVDEPEDEWLERVLEDADSVGDSAADEGTRIHGAIEAFYNEQQVPSGYELHVEGVRRLLDEHCGKQWKWTTEMSFAHPDGFGSKADLHSEAWVIDFKGKDGDDAAFSKLEVYEDHWMQLAATRKGLRLQFARAAIVYVSRTHPGVCRLIEISEEDLFRGWKMFSQLLKFWQTKNKIVCEPS